MNPKFIPTSDQLKAQIYDRNVAVTAGAGSGKTRVLVERYVRILENNPELTPLNLVAITFTRKAAAELRDRIRLKMQNKIDSMKPGTGSPEFWITRMDHLTDAPITTIHSFIAEILREFALYTQLDPGFTIVEESEYESMKEMVIQRYYRELSEDKPEFLSRIARYYAKTELTAILMDLANPDAINLLGKTCLSDEDQMNSLWDLLITYLSETWNPELTLAQLKQPEVLGERLPPT